MCSGLTGAAHSQFAGRHEPAKGIPAGLMGQKAPTTSAESIREAQTAHRVADRVYLR